MRKAFLMFALLIAAGAAFAQVNIMEEQGSMLVFPLVDNCGTKTTYLSIANRGADDVWLQGFMIAWNAPQAQVNCDDVQWIKKDFFIHLTAREPFFWNTSLPYNRKDVDDVRTQIQGFDEYQGFCFVWAINSIQTQMELSWNSLLGEALILDGPRAFAYNAIPHQALTITADRVLDLDGVEYTMAPSQIMLSGIAAGVSGVSGKLAVCSLEIDFINSIQPEFDINLIAWNQYEVPQTRHLHVCQFALLDQVYDLQLGVQQIFTPRFHMTATSTSPMWAVFYQQRATQAWCVNVQQHGASGVPVSVVLPPVVL